MKILVSEFVCGGGWPASCLPPLLFSEGRGMLQAIVNDLCRLPGVTIETTLDQNLLELISLPEEVTIIPVESESVSDEWETLLDRAQNCDGVFLIAPEIDGILLDRVERFKEAGVRLFNSDCDAVRLTADKLETYKFCVRNDIATIETRPAWNLQFEDPPWPATVVKQRHGAGGLDMQLLTCTEEYLQFCDNVELDQFIMQPYIKGQAISVATIISGPDDVLILPVGAQKFSPENQFAYVGGQIPIQLKNIEAIEALVRKVVALIPGLYGWTGFDIMIPDDSPTDPLVVDINPRLTTSYIGYRALSDTNLAAWLINPGLRPAPTFRGQVRFQSNSQLEIQ
ncbi:ATP-grasp domain-containing protein [Planctomicrobium sp. SH527]|uniref:ATP-grasp domain-containing protein n=1 Tax=Planctomicrobium sp. SH527 TaxID=3448123 RepID=UPI003F5AEB39